MGQSTLIKPKKNTMSTQTLYLYKPTTSLSKARTSSSINSALRSGQGVTYQARFNAAGNTQRKCQKNGAALDRDTENLSHKRVSASTRKIMQEARNRLGLTQKELAVKINERASLINDYEQGKAIPNSQVLNKLHKALNVYLNGKNAGQEF